jgi:hypothetical protein
VTAPLDAAREWFDSLPPLIRPETAMLICCAAIEDPLGLDDNENDLSAISDMVHVLLQPTGDERQDGVRALRFRSAVELALTDRFDPEQLKNKRKRVEHARDLVRAKGGKAPGLDRVLMEWDFRAAQWAKAGESWAVIRGEAMSDRTLNRLIFVPP